MAQTVLVAGTASHVGKSTFVTGLCRLLARQGVSVCPFKAQNMSNNAHAVPVSGGDGYGEIGVSQYVQANAAGVTPSTAMNPVLLKPRGDGESELVINGQRVGWFNAGSYYADHWEKARAAAVEAFEYLAAKYDVIVAEGAGGVGEINLHHRDLANRETARFSDAGIVLLADIDRGGAFASLYGSIELMPGEMRERLRGTVITKFRGDRSVLDPGIDSLVEQTGVPVLGVIPADSINLPAEDSVSLGEEVRRTTIGGDAYPPNESVTIGVPRLPHISNFTDVFPLGFVPGVQVDFLPLHAAVESVDAVIVPGTKNTVDDLMRVRDAGMARRLRRFTGPILGICGGYQMMGTTLHNVEIESTHQTGSLPGLGLLPVETTFAPDKHVEQSTYPITECGFLKDLSGSVTGYEIHLGTTTRLRDVVCPLGPESSATDQYFGTYLHGLFENPNFREAFVAAVYDRAEKNQPSNSQNAISPIDAVADLVETNVGLGPLNVPLDSTSTVEFPRGI